VKDLFPFHLSGCGQAGHLNPQVSLQKGDEFTAPGSCVPKPVSSSDSYACRARSKTYPLPIVLQYLAQPDGLLGFLSASRRIPQSP